MIFNKAPGVHIEPCFLEAEDHAELLASSLEQEAVYEPSRVTQYDEGKATSSRLNERTRRSQSRDLEDRFINLFRRKVCEISDRISEVTGIAFPVKHKFETEAVQYGDGAFFGNHIDTITGERNNHRVISAIYYYSRTPKRFTGGQLKIYSVYKKEFITVQPEDNTMVFFGSIFPHEVLPVSVPSDEFGDGRFSVNCWVQRVDKLV